MKRAAVLAALAAVVLLAFACEQKKEKPLSVPGEKLYTVEGKILSRRSSDNTINVDHKEIPGFMTAMTMDYSVRGAKVEDLPADGSVIVAKLHAANDSYWLTDVKKK